MSAGMFPDTAAMERAFGRVSLRATFGCCHDAHETFAALLKRLQCGAIPRVAEGQAATPQLFGLWPPNTPRPGRQEPEAPCNAALPPSSPRKPTGGSAAAALSSGDR